MWKILVILTLSGLVVACEGDVKTSVHNNDGTDSDSNTETDTGTDLFVDSDGDGLPDSWELRYFGDLDEVASGDPDGDGLTNLEEFDIGTDPTSTVNDTDTEVGPDCADTPWNVDVQPINILVLLDRSKSMENSKIGADTYAQTVQAAIDQIVEQNTRSGIINFALNVFPDASSCTEAFGELSGTQAAAQDSDYGIRCAGASGYTGTGAAGDPTVPFSANVTMDTYTAISNALATTGQCGGTPVCNTLKWARAYLTANAPEGKTFVLLATDGAPSCNTKLDKQNCKSSLADGTSVTNAVQCLDDMCTYNEAYMLAVEGRPLYLIGVGEEVGSFATVMDVIAYYGTGGSAPPGSLPDPPGRADWYYPAASAADLSAALEDITNNSLSCVFDVDWAGVPDFDSDANVPVNKACDKVNIYGILSDASDTDTVDTDNKAKVSFAVDCANEGDSLGWNWADMPGATWGEVKEAGADVSKCTQVQLCPNACDALKVHGGVKTWETATAKFGCIPIVID